MQDRLKKRFLILNPQTSIFYPQLFNFKFRILLIILPLVIVPAGCSVKDQLEAPLTPVTVQPVVTLTGVSTARYSANVVPYAQVTLAFKVGGYVEEILKTKGPDGRLREVQEGEFVKKGEVLARVRQSDYLAALNQAKAALVQAEAGHIKAKEDFERASNLYATDSLTKSDYDAAKANYDATKGQKEQASASIDSATISLKDTELQAPMDSVVLQRSIEIGSFVGPGTPGYVLADTRVVKAVFGVPDFIVARAKLGMPIHIISDSLPGPGFKGEVTAIAAAADQSSRVFNVEVTIPNPGFKLKAGMIATVDVKEGGLEQVAAAHVPAVLLSAIVRAKDNPKAYSVFVVQQEGDRQIARARVVQIGQVYGNNIAVDGVKVGELVIVNGATLVFDGQEVRVTP